MEIISYLEQRGIQLNEQQQQGVLADTGNTLLLAVPGSGKTTVLVARIAHLIYNRGVAPSRILTITFNRETAKDMKNRYLGLFGSLNGGAAKPTFVTIHSFCLSVLKYYARVKNRSMPHLISGEDAGLKNRVIRDIYRRRVEEFPGEDDLENIDRLIGYVKNAMIGPEEIREEDCRCFPEIFADYESFKRENQLIDFDDMLTLALDIFEKFPSILGYYQSLFDFVNVDEAQDTSLVQHRLIERFASNASLFMVGDEDQSIYSFRGACPQALLEFPKRYPGGSVLKMEENFRSNRDIVQSADRFIRQNQQRFEKHMFCRNERQNSLEVISLEDYAQQYTQTLSILKALPAGKTAAVLYRNNESAIPMIDLFYWAGTEFYIREHKLSYFSSNVVRDLTAYILLAADGRDVASFGQIYYKLGYSKGIYSYVKDHIREYDSVFDCILSVSSLPAYRKGHTRRYREGFSALFRLKPAAAVDFILEELNYQDYLENRVTSSTVRIGAYQKLNTAKCLGRGLGSVYQFLDRLEELEKAILARQQISSGAGITLSTLHSAKGMEFDVVILLDMLQNILPSSEASDKLALGKRDDYENEVRLFYVGATRAKEKLVLYRSYQMNGTEAPPSVFLKSFLGEC